VIKSLLAAAAFSFLGMLASAQAATLSGSFNVTAVNVTNLNSAQSQATRANFDAALLGNLGGLSSMYASDTFTYTGAINFATNAGPGGNSATTIGSWLATGGGMLSGLDATFAGLQQSKGSIGSGTATTTFYLFESVLDVVGVAGAKVRHDDGFAIFRNGSAFAGIVGPTTVKNTTLASAFDRGRFELLYVATNSDPSILKVEGLAPVPLPAPVALLAAGLAGLGALRLRRKAA
jgi:hypothetical protein